MKFRAAIPRLTNNKPRWETLKFCGSGPSSFGTEFLVNHGAQSFFAKENSGVILFLKSDTRIEKSMMFDTWVVGGMWVGWDVVGYVFLPNFFYYCDTDD